MISRYIFCTVILIFFSCSSDSSDFAKSDYTDQDQLDGNNEPADFKVLFIGNSLTYYNDLPFLVKEFAKENEVIIETHSAAIGNYALIDHWNDGLIQNLIENGGFDFVVVQQGPSSQDYGRDLLFEAGDLISDLCRTNNTQLAFYMVWPARQYYHTFQGVIDNYRAASERNNDLLCPVGEVWKRHFDETEDFSYYDPSDDFHPSLKGSMVAAEVIFESLFED